MWKSPPTLPCPPSPTGRRARGFTLPEMLVTLTVMSILAAVAAPQMESALSDSRLRSIAAEFADSLSTARTEAAKRGVPVVMCPRTSGANTCDVGATNWNQGWVIFSNATGSGTMAGADTLLSARSAVPSGYTVGAVTGQGAMITVLPSGEHLFAAGSTRTIKFTKGGGKRYVVVSRVGRASVLADTQCTAAVYCTP